MNMSTESQLPTSVLASASSLPSSDTTKPHGSLIVTIVPVAAAGILLAVIGWLVYTIVQNRQRQRSLEALDLEARAYTVQSSSMPTDLKALGGQRKMGLRPLRLASAATVITTKSEIAKPAPAQTSRTAVVPPFNTLSKLYVAEPRRDFIRPLNLPGLVKSHSMGNPSSSKGSDSSVTEGLESSPPVTSKRPVLFKRCLSAFGDLSSRRSHPDTVAKADSSKTASCAERSSKDSSEESLEDKGEMREHK